VLASSVTGVGVLLTQADPGAPRLSERTIYTSATWGLVGCLALVGLVMVGVAPSSSARFGIRRLAPAVGLVLAAQVAGTGCWAAKHWEPFYGMSGGVAPLRQMQVLAGVLVLCGVMAGAASLWQLAATGELRLPAGWPGAWVCTGVGLLIVAVLPWIIAAGEPDYTDFTSIGAFALIYSIPWGGALAVAGWLRRSPALAVTGAVAGTAVWALVGPSMGDVGPSNPAAGFAVAALVALVLGVLIVRRPGPAEGSDGTQSSSQAAIARLG
jgi:hypothetical protein